VPLRSREKVTNPYPPELRELELQLIASFTPQQRYLASARALDALDKSLTPYQREITERMKPYQVGLTTEQAERAAYRDVIQTNWDRGQREGGIIAWIGWGVAAALLLLFFASRC
jgi:hypothetical protein